MYMWIGFYILAIIKWLCVPDRPNNEYYFLKYMSRIINDANAYINGNQVNATWKQKVEG